MDPKFYARKPVRHIDGTMIFRNREDAANEKAVAQYIGEKLGCTIRPFADLSPVDWYAETDGRLTGVLELKCRSHPSTKYRTVYLNVRKWLALMLASNGLGVPAMFVVRFEDGVKWVNVADVPAHNVRIGGCAFKRKESDVEPLIEVPVSLMTDI